MSSFVSEKLMRTSVTSVTVASGQDTGLFGFYGESDEATLDGYLDELLFAAPSSGTSTMVESVIGF